MTRKMKIALALLALATGGGGPGDGGGCNCNCDWGDKTPSGGTGWVEPEAAPPVAAPQPAQDAPREAPAGVRDEARTKQTAEFCEKHPQSCSPVPIKQVKVERGRWPEWYVRRTPGANIHATADCNGWPRGTNPVIQPGKEIGICGW